MTKKRNSMTAIMLSIKPEFSRAIFAGTKRWELRRRLPLLLPTRRVLVYETAPTSAVVGEFTASEVLAMPPALLWQATASCVGIDRERFDEYFAGRAKGYALRVYRPTLYDRPRPLSVYGVKAAPQSIVYVDSECQRRQIDDELESAIFRDSRNISR